MTDSGKAIQLMSGNEAFARGALEAGVKFCASYPGTPSTEITATLMRWAEVHGLHVEWSTNEKVALEACTGASWAGIPALCPMKSLGLNVAADFLLNLNLSGTGDGGLVIVVCDDPRGHSSSNEQDSRFYAKAASLPLFEPATSQQAKDMVGHAIKLSQRYKIPVIIRSTTRLSHSKALVKLGPINQGKWKARSIPSDLYNVPDPHLRHRDLLNKLEMIREEFESDPFNSMVRNEINDLLIISTGIGQMYVQEALSIAGLEGVATLGLGTTYPLPKELVMKALSKVDHVLFVEEVDPFVEEQVRAILEGINLRIYGKFDGTIPAYGEINTDTILNALMKMGRIWVTDEGDEIRERAARLLIPRPLTFCPGCSHRNVYWAIRKVRQRLGGRLSVIGDIGCYSLGVFYDHAMDTMQAMGSGIGIAGGLGQLSEFGFEDKIIAVAGDSTFFHACIPGLINAKHKGSDVTFMILDNGTTAMTGFQGHPGSCSQSNLMTQVSIEGIVKAIQPDELVRADSQDIPRLVDLIHTNVKKRGLKVLILEGVCALERRRAGHVIDSLHRITINSDSCIGEKCRICASQFGCPAIAWNNDTKKPYIIDHLCTRCRACIGVCPQSAIIEERLE